MEKFKTGRVVITSKIESRIEKDPAFSFYLWDCFDRYVTGDWGDMLSDEDIEMNNEALKNNESLLGSYKHPNDKSLEIWIITESDRSVTTILFPDEY